MTKPKIASPETKAAPAEASFFPGLVFGPPLKKPRRRAMRPGPDFSVPRGSSCCARELDDSDRCELEDSDRAPPVPGLCGLRV